MNQARFLVLCNEALGLNYKEALDSSYALIDALLQESAYLNNERNKPLKQDGEEVEGVDYEWIELPDFDNPEKTKRVKKYFDAAGKI